MSSPERVLCKVPSAPGATHREPLGWGDCVSSPAGRESQIRLAPSHTSLRDTTSSAAGCVSRSLFGPAPVHCPSELTSTLTVPPLVEPFWFQSSLPSAGRNGDDAVG